MLFCREQLERELRDGRAPARMVIASTAPDTFLISDIDDIRLADLGYGDLVYYAPGANLTSTAG